MEFNIPAFNNLDFTPIGPSIDMLASPNAEPAVMAAIIEGSGGPNNLEPTDFGLRFIRHLLSTSQAAKLGKIPNFKNMEFIQDIAHRFIRQCGSHSKAIQILASLNEAI